MTLAALLPSGSSCILNSPKSFNRQDIDDPFISRRNPAFYLEPVPASSSSPSPAAGGCTELLLLKSGCASDIIVEHEGPSGTWTLLHVLGQVRAGGTDR